MKCIADSCSRRNVASLRRICAACSVQRAAEHTAERVASRCVACCMLRVASCTLRAVCCTLRAVRCMLQATRCNLHLIRCTSRAVTCKLRVVSCMLHVACCALHVACCTSRIVTCTSHVACCTLHAACCKLHVAWHALHVACCTSRVGRLYAQWSGGREHRTGRGGRDHSRTVSAFSRPCSKLTATISTIDLRRRSSRGPRKSDGPATAIYQRSLFK